MCPQRWVIILYLFQPERLFVTDVGTLCSIGWNYFVFVSVLIKDIKITWNHPDRIFVAVLITDNCSKNSYLRVTSVNSETPIRFVKVSPENVDLNRLFKFMRPTVTSIRQRLSRRQYSSKTLLRKPMMSMICLWSHI